MKPFWLLFTSVWLAGCLLNGIAFAEDDASSGTVHDAGQVQVSAEGKRDSIVTAPSISRIDLEDHETPGVPRNISDYMKDLVIFDSREESNLVPSNDTLYMRGFGPRRFLVAVDTLPVEKSGFGYGNHAVDYAVIPLSLIEDLEVVYGPHSALYPGQAIAGVVNVKTKRSPRNDDLKPGLNVTTTSGSYETLHNRISFDGGNDTLGYHAGYEMYETDGYLRNNSSDIDTVYGKLEWVSADKGYLSITGSQTDHELGLPVNNDPVRTDFDSDYPEVDVCRYNPDQDPRLDKKAESFRLNGDLATSLGDFSLGAYYNQEKSNQHSWLYINPGDPSQGLRPDWFGKKTVWEQAGGRLQDEITWTDNHTTTIGFDTVVAYSERQHVDRHKRLVRNAGYLQHQWQATSSLFFQGGLRYEKVSTWIHNRGTDRSTGELTGYLNTAEEKDYVERNFDEVIPKFYGTLDLDDLADGFRDTSVSLGVSRIWHAPTSGMDLHGNGIPGFHVDPEHGLGVDLIFMRRLVADINLRVNYSYYDIEDFIAYNNRKYAEYIPMPGNPVPSGLEYLDGRINLEGVTKQGVELELSGHLKDNLSAYAGYAYTNFENQGNEPVGKEEVSDRAEHRVNLGLRYNVLPRTALLLDYQYQSEQTTYTSVETSPDVWEFNEVSMGEYHVVDAGLEQQLFADWGPLNQGRLKIFVNNVFDEKYQDARGYPMTDRFYGAELQFNM